MTTSSPPRRCFVIMPFGKKPAPDHADIDFDAVYERFLEPAITEAGLVPHRADSEQRAGSIHLDMFQELLLAEFVVADLTIDNPNVWYEIGVRHALRAGGSALTFALRNKIPFDLVGERMHHYTLAKDGKPDESKVEVEKAALTAMIKATVGAWRGRRVSPVYQRLPYLREPNWKRLKVGDINEYWEKLEVWTRRIDAAKLKGRPGDVLVLADEAPNSLLEFDALKVAAETLKDLGRPHFALAVLQKARLLDPTDLRVQQLEGMCLGKAKRFAEAKIALRELVKRRRDVESGSLYARTFKDEWMRRLERHPLRKQDPKRAGRDTAPTLLSAVREYYKIFRSFPGDFFPGINALTLGRLWEHLTSAQIGLPLDLVEAGLTWCTTLGDDYWAIATRGELAIAKDNKKVAVESYQEAARIAISEGAYFNLASSRDQLELLEAFEFRTDIVKACRDLIFEAMKDVGEPSGEPKRVVVFSGHMIDKADRKTSRFPGDDETVRKVKGKIVEALDEIEAGEGDLGLCGGACGGDLLFAEACRERGMGLEVRLAKQEAEFRNESVNFNEKNREWSNRFDAMKRYVGNGLLFMPDELGPAPEGVSVHDRCNRWIMNSALARGLDKVSFVAVWDGEEGDGPGGTKNMVGLVETLTGRKPKLINPRAL